MHKFYSSEAIFLHFSITSFTHGKLSSAETVTDSDLNFELLQLLNATWLKSAVPHALQHHGGGHGTKSSRVPWYPSSSCAHSVTLDGQVSASTAALRCPHDTGACACVRGVLHFLNPGDGYAGININQLRGLFLSQLERLTVRTICSLTGE